MGNPFVFIYKNTVCNDSQHCLMYIRYQLTGYVCVHIHSVQGPVTKAKLHNKSYVFAPGSYNDTNKSVVKPRVSLR